MTKRKKSARGSARKPWWRVLGPGLITGASDDDPSGIATYSQAGAAFGLGFLWTAFVSYPLMATVQYICAKIALVTGRGLAATLKSYYPKWIAISAVALLAIANVINVAADLGALGAAVNLLVPKVPILFAIVPCTVGILLLQVFGSYKLINRVFKWLCISLFAYIATAFFLHPNWAHVLQASVSPHLSWDRQYLQMIVAILGTTISPYLFFWQAENEVEEQKEEGKTTVAQRKGATKGELEDAAVDVNVGMFFSNLVMYFIILATGLSLHAGGTTKIESAQQAALALKPLVGDWAFLLFAAGLIGTSLLAVPVLTSSAAYSFAEIFGWKRNINANVKGAPAFYAVITVATVLGMVLNFVGVNPIHALIFTAVINGLLAPPLMVLIMLISNRKDIMGARTNGTAVNILGWAATVVMAVAGIALICSWSS